MPDDHLNPDRDNQPIQLPAPVPGERVSIIEMDYADLPRTSRGAAGMRLSRLVDELGGYEGDLTHPFTRERLHVSITHLRDRDPDNVWVYVAFIDEAAPTPPPEA